MIAAVKREVTPGCGCGICSDLTIDSLRRKKRQRRLAKVRIGTPVRASLGGGGYVIGRCAGGSRDFCIVRITRCCCTDRDYGYGAYKPGRELQFEWGEVTVLPKRPPATSLFAVAKYAVAGFSRLYFVGLRNDEERSVMPIALFACVEDAKVFANKLEGASVFRLREGFRNTKRIAERMVAEAKWRRKQVVVRTGISKRLRMMVFARDNARCVLCGKSAEDGLKMHCDHIIPVSKGGETTMDNLRVLCSDCNLGRNNKVDI